MKYYQTYTCLLLLLVCTCKGSDKSSITNTPSIAIENRRCQQTVRNFIQWYHANYKKIKSERMISVDSIDSSYHVNFENTEKYLTRLLGSGFFTTNFVNNVTKYFQEADIKLRKLKQTDCPAIGFEADRLLMTQEAEDMLDDREKFSYLTSVIRSRIAVKLKWYDHTTVFLLDSNNCKIDSIYLD